RRASADQAGFRYVFCDRGELMVIFRTRDDARTYAALPAPDRPLFLARVASEKLAGLERSEDVARIRAFLRDPDALRGYSREEVDSMASAATALLRFQHQLESALVQSMTELERSGVRGYYYELHRRILR